MNLLPAFSLFLCMSVSLPGGRRCDNENVVRKDGVFRTRKIITVWEEAVKVSCCFNTTDCLIVLQSSHHVSVFPDLQLLKGEKLKSLMTELKAHEKLMLSLKKKRHTTLSWERTADMDKEWDEWDGSTFANIPKGKQKHQQERQDEDEARLEQDLVEVLKRFHLSPSLTTRYRNSEAQGQDFESSDNHINSVVDRAADGRRKQDHERFRESRANDLYQVALRLQEEVVADAGRDEEQGQRRVREFTNWLTSSLDRDLDMLESRLRKAAFLEQQLDQERQELMSSRRKGEDLPDNLPERQSVDDLKKRLKDLKYKISKSEKEIADRIANRRSQEFPTSRSEGEL